MSTDSPTLPPCWTEALAPVFASDSYRALRMFLDQRYQVGATIWPAKHEIFRAIKEVPIASVKVVILGQDPYIGPGQANGFAFAVNHGFPPPPSLRNIFSEIEADLHIRLPKHHTTLTGWAKQGVLLLNSCLTVEEGLSGSHANKGWEKVTDAIIKTISEKNDHVVFMLWGDFAKSKMNLINARKHARLEAAHPSPLSANKGFFGCRHFSRANKLLRNWKRQEIDWSQVDSYRIIEKVSEFDKLTRILGV